MRLYEVLGVDANASADDIKKSFRHLSKSRHPDGGGSDDQFNELKRAFDILSDPVRRKKYDDTGDESETAVDNSHVELMSVVSVALDTVMLRATKDNRDFASVDFPDEMIDFLRFSADATRQQIVQLKKDIAKLERMRGRFRKKNDGENVLDGMVTSKIETKNITISSMIGGLVLNQKAQEFIADYSFDSEETRLREQAIRNVLAVRGSTDAPGFDACVEAEIADLRRLILPRN